MSSVGALIKRRAALVAAQVTGSYIFRHGSIHVKKIQAEDLVVDPEQEVADARQVKDAF